MSPATESVLRPVIVLRQAGNTPVSRLLAKFNSDRAGMLHTTSGNESNRFSETSIVNRNGRPESVPGREPVSSFPRRLRYIRLERFPRQSGTEWGGGGIP